MEFRAPIVAAERNAKAELALTKRLSDPEAGRRLLGSIINELGNAVDSYPDWHPIEVARHNGINGRARYSQPSLYEGEDHTVNFVRGFITCPYSNITADQIVNRVNKVPELHAYRLQGPLHADGAYPVMVIAKGVELEDDGTIRSRDALAWFTQQSAREAQSAEVAETWWNIRSNILGVPHGSRSSLFVNQPTGLHMRKILDAMNNSGMFGPVKEWSLAMLSERKRKAIGENLVRAAVENWDRKSEQFDFNLQGETCKVALRDTWKDGYELSVRITIGDHDLYLSGFYYPQEDKITHSDPTGKRAIAEKFL